MIQPWLEEFGSVPPLSMLGHENSPDGLITTSDEGRL